MHNKKAQEGGSLSIITKAVLVLLVLFVLIAIFLKFLPDQSKMIDEKICGLEHDQDNDGYPDTVDRCPCDTGRPLTCATAADVCKQKIYEGCQAKK